MQQIHTMTPLGWFEMDIDDSQVVCTTRFIELAQGADIHPYAQSVQDYFSGDLTALDAIPRKQHTTLFYGEIYRTLSAIPPGSTMSYAEIARAIGRENAVRAVGTACRKNQLPLLIPCHRVVKSDGTLGNYVFGTDMKQRLLAHESRHK